MTEPGDERRQGPPERIVVPGGPPRRPDPPDAADAFDEVVLDEEQQVRDLGSASRSCVAILAAMLIIALLVCVFLVWAFAIR